MVAHIRADDIPVVAVEREEAAHVHAQPFNHVVLRESELLDHVTQSRLDRREAEVFPQAAVRDHVDAGDLRTAQIEGDPVGLTVA
jgi:hypothetical protein